MALTKCCKNCVHYRAEHEVFWVDDNVGLCSKTVRDYCMNIEREVSRTGCCNGYYENRSISDADSYKPW